MLITIRVLFWFFTFIVITNAEFYINKVNKTDMRIEVKNVSYTISYNKSTVDVHWEIDVNVHQTSDLFLLADNKTVPKLSKKYDYNITLTDIFMKIRNVSEADLNTVFHLFANRSSDSRIIPLTFYLNDPLKVYIESYDFDNQGYAEAKCIATSMYSTDVYWGRKNQNQIISAAVNKTGLQTTSTLKLPKTTAVYYCRGNNSKSEENAAIADVVVLENEFEIYEIAGNAPSEDRIEHIDNKRKKLVVERNTIVKLVCGVSMYKYTDKVKWTRSNLQNEIKDSSVSGKYAIYSYLQKLELSGDVAGSYFCKAFTKDGTLKFKQIDIEYPISSGSIQFIIPTVLSIVSLISISVIIIVRVRKNTKVQGELHELYEVGLSKLAKKDYGHLNPNLPIEEQVHLLPYDKSFEFSGEDLILGEQIGSGAFGVVLRGEAKGLFGGEEVTPVAVKMVNRTVGDCHLKDLASELKIMIYLGKHVNIVNLLGACTKNVVKKELLVIVEYCALGNLKNYILSHKETFIDQRNVENDKIDFSIGGDLCKSSDLLTGLSITSKIHVLDDETVEQSSKIMCTRDLLVWSFQISRGMEYLSSKRVVHGDLAARNILLSHDNVVKICDFGLSRKIYQSDIYKKTSNDMLPVKWMAIESIVERVFSIQSDIWSFGVVLWEFFSLGETPYAGMRFNEEFCEKLLDGYRMEIPQYATSELFEIMLQCWDSKPVKRPSFGELSTKLGLILEEPVRNYYIEMNNGYVKMFSRKVEDRQEEYVAMNRIQKCTFPSYVNTSGHVFNT